MLDPRSTARQLDPSRRRRGKPAPGPSERRTPRGLAIAIAVLLVLIVISRSGRSGTPALGTDTRGPERTAMPPPELPPPPPARPSLPPAPVVPPPPVSTPALDLLVRLEARRRVVRAGAMVYLDSLLADSDSVLRRWPERRGEAVTVALLRDSLFTAARVDPRPVQDAFARWQDLPLGLRFSVITDTGAADIVVQWTDRFEPERRRTGQTDLEVAPDGAIRHARITLSLREPEGRPLDRAALAAAAMHEVGHALGLGHSDRPGDVMHPMPRSAALSDRDRRTAELLYRLPPGSVRGSS